MKQIPLIFLSLLLLTSAPFLLSAEKPTRIVSTDLCLDQLLLHLAKPEHIASLTYLSVKPEYTTLTHLVPAIPLNHGLAEEIIPLQPDLVLTTPFSPGKATQLLKRQGIPVLELPIPNSIDDMIALIDQISTAIDEIATGQALTHHLRTRIQQLKTTTRIRGTALSYAPNGYTGGVNSLHNEALTLAGWKNLAAELGINGYGSLPIETLMRHAPDLLILDGITHDSESRAQQLLKHPALKHLPDIHTISLPAHTWLCATPALIDTIERLANLPLRNP